MNDNELVKGLANKIGTAMPTPAPDNQVYAQMELLSQAIDQLGDRVELLDSRLERVCTPKIPRPAQDLDKTELVPLAYSIYKQKELVNTIYDMVEDILTRLQV